MSEPTASTSEFIVQDCFEPVPDGPALERLVAVERDGDGWRNAASAPNFVGNVYGGQLAATLVSAAIADCPDSLPHSFSIVYASRGHADRPYRLEVERKREGRRLQHLAITIEQEGTILAYGTAVMHPRDLDDSARSLDRCAPMRKVPGPEDMTPRMQLDDSQRLGSTFSAHVTGFPYFDIRAMRFEEASAGSDTASAPYWLRIPQAQDLDAAAHYGLLALASDFWYSLPVHGFAGKYGDTMKEMRMTSVDHTMLFHRVPRTDRWMLFEAEVIGISQGIGTICLSIRDQEGQLVATAMQQTLVRQR